MLREALSRAGVNQETAGLSAFGKDFGSAETIRLGRLANENPPSLRIVDATGTRNDFVDFHPAYHALMQKSMAAGLHCPASAPDEPAGSQVSERAARLYMATQIEAGHLCPTTMTSASVAALAASPDVYSAWLPHLVSRDYDGAMKPWFEKRAVTLGMGMTERQGGTDVRAIISEARACDGIMKFPVTNGFCRRRCRMPLLCSRRQKPVLLRSLCRGFARMEVSTRSAFNA